MKKSENFEKVKKNLLSYEIAGAYYVGKILESKFGMLVIGYLDPEKDLIYYLNVATNGYDEMILEITYKELTKREFDSKIDFFKDEYGIRAVKRGCISIALDCLAEGQIERYENSEYIKSFYDLDNEDCEFNYISFQIANLNLSSFNNDYEEQYDKEVKKDLYQERFFQYYKNLEQKDETIKDDNERYFLTKIKKILKERRDIKEDSKDLSKDSEDLSKDSEDLSKDSDNKEIYKKLRDNISIRDLNYENYLNKYRTDNNILEDDKLYNKEFASIKDSLLTFYNYSKDDKTLKDYPFDNEPNKVTEDNIMDLWNLYVYREFKLYGTDFYKELKEKLSYFTEREIDYLFINKLAYFKFDLRIITELKFENSRIIEISYEKRDILKERYLIMVKDYNKELEDVYQTVLENQENKNFTIITKDSDIESLYSKEDEEIILKLKKLIIKDRKNPGLHFLLGVSLVKNRYLSNEKDKLKDGELEFLIFLKDAPKSIYTYLRLIKIYCNLSDYEELALTKIIVEKNIESLTDSNELKAYEIIKSFKI